MFSQQPGPASAQLAAGEMVSRTCAAAGNPRPVLTWEKDDVPLTGSEPFLMLEATTIINEFEVSRTLTLGPTSEEAVAGNYSCVAEGASPDGSPSSVRSSSTIIEFTCA